MTPGSMAALHAACFETPRPWRRDEFADLLASPHVFAHARGEEAFILGRIAGPEAEVLTLAVAPAARRQGVARALIRAFEATARARGAEEAFLEVAADNTAAIALYLAEGYAESGLRRDYYTTPSGGHVAARILSRRLEAG